MNKKDYFKNKFEEQHNANLFRCQRDKDELILYLASLPDLKEVVIIGTTPGFNDGDACYHSHDVVYVNNLNSYGERPDIDEHDEDYEELGIMTSEDWFGDKFLKDDSVKQNEEFSKELTEIINMHEDVLETLHGTNWVIKWTFDDGKLISEKMTDYESSY